MRRRIRSANMHVDQFGSRYQETSYPPTHRGSYLELSSPSVDNGEGDGDGTYFRKRHPHAYNSDLQLNWRYTPFFGFQRPRLDIVHNCLGWLCMNNHHHRMCVSVEQLPSSRRPVAPRLWARWNTTFCQSRVLLWQIGSLLRGMARDEAFSRRHTKAKKVIGLFWLTRDQSCQSATIPCYTRGAGQ